MPAFPYATVENQPVKVTYNLKDQDGNVLESIKVQGLFTRITSKPNMVQIGNAVLNSADITSLTLIDSTLPGETSVSI